VMILDGEEDGHFLITTSGFLALAGGEVSEAKVFWDVTDGLRVSVADYCVKLGEME